MASPVCQSTTICSVVAAIEAGGLPDSATRTAAKAAKPARYCFRFRRAAVIVLRNCAVIRVGFAKA
jgi:hypothetical protein